MTAHASNMTDAEYEAAKKVRARRSGTPPGILAQMSEWHSVFIAQVKAATHNLKAQRSTATKSPKPADVAEGHEAFKAALRASIGELQKIHDNF